MRSILSHERLCGINWGFIKYRKALLLLGSIALGILSVESPSVGYIYCGKYLESNLPRRPSCPTKTKPRCMSTIRCTNTKTHMSFPACLRYICA
jgi:hypothetical protein